MPADMFGLKVKMRGGILDGAEPFCTPGPEPGCGPAAGPVAAAESRSGLGNIPPCGYDGPVPIVKMKAPGGGPCAGLSEAMLDGMCGDPLS